MGNDTQASRIGTQLLSVLILARLLPPSDYGLVAMATTITGFVSLFRDFGTTADIIQKTDPRSLLLPFWYIVRSLAPWLDKLDSNWAAESAGYYCTAREA